MVNRGIPCCKTRYKTRKIINSLWLFMQKIKKRLSARMVLEKKNEFGFPCLKTEAARRRKNPISLFPLHPATSVLEFQLYDRKKHL
jgi:hypothetical protein